MGHKKLVIIPTITRGGLMKSALSRMTQAARNLAPEQSALDRSWQKKRTEFA